MLHIFNPEHDIALASNLDHFTPPHAARQLRYDLGWIPAIWAKKHDCVLVDDTEYATISWQRFLKTNHLQVEWGGEFISRINTCCQDFVSPWGWDRALRSYLDRAGVDHTQLPDSERLQTIRQMSHRQLAKRLLLYLHREGMVGESHVCTNEKELQDLLLQHERLVIKAPWSSSGRGVRFVDHNRNTIQMLTGWIRNVISKQGCVMAEPYYHKVKDFGMEFEVDQDGTVNYLGLSLFQTKNGAYSGNVLATEQFKRKQMSKYFPLALLDDVACSICQHTKLLFEGHYVGPFGVDMMVCTGSNSFLLHPCVELNLRRTMGHVALALEHIINPNDDDGIYRVMRIVLNDHYQLKIDKE